MYTDLNFSLHLLNQSGRNFHSEIQLCRPDFEIKLNKTLDYCRGSQFDEGICLQLLQDVRQYGKSCFNKEQRFDTTDHPSENYKIAGIVSVIHCALPVIISIIVWLFQNSFKIWNFKTFVKLPHPLLSSFYKFHYTRKLLGVHVKDRKGDNNRWFYELCKTQWMEKLRKNEAVVNLSHLIEATTESSFQFWFQTIFYIPHIFIASTDDLSSWKDLLSWSGASIMASFGTFALTFFNIR